MSDMIPGVNKIGGTASVASPTELGGLRGGGALSGGPTKFLGPKTPLDWLKIGLNSGQKKCAYIFENTPEKLIWKPPYKFLQPKGQRRGWGSISGASVTP